MKRPRLTAEDGRAALADRAALRADTQSVRRAVERYIFPSQFRMRRFNRTLSVALDATVVLEERIDGLPRPRRAG